MIHRGKTQSSQDLSLKYRELSTTIIKLFDAILEIEKRPVPFVIKHNASIIAKHFRTIAEYSEDKNYDKIVIETLLIIKELREDMNLTKEHIKLLDKKYIIGREF